MNRVTRLLLALAFCPNLALLAQDRDEAALKELIAEYSLARETKDTALLRSILTPDIDQLVSTGEWRRGIAVAIEGMVRSSASNPGERVLIVEHARILGQNTAIVDCRYEIHNPDGTVRRMWSTFYAVRDGQDWKIAAIRNMLPNSP